MAFIEDIILKPCFLKMQILRLIIFSLNAIYVFNSADKKEYDIIMTSLPVEVLLCIESFPGQSRIILLHPYKSLERFLDK